MLVLLYNFPFATAQCVSHPFEVDTNMFWKAIVWSEIGTEDLKEYTVYLVSTFWVPCLLRLGCVV